MSMFIESPWPATLLCIGSEVCLAMLFMRTGKALVVVMMAVVLAVSAGLILMEQTIVTDTEQVEDTLHGVAESLAANDMARVLAAFAPSCPGHDQVQSILPTVLVSSASVGSDLEVRISKLTNPPQATTYFTGRIEAKSKRGTIPYEKMFRKFKVKLERRGDHWLIVDYTDAQIGSKNNF